MFCVATPVMFRQRRPATLGTTLDPRALAYLEQNLMAADHLPADMARVECGDLLAAYVRSGKLLVSRRRVRRLADLDASGPLWCRT
jgi:hypothetical protein